MRPMYERDLTSGPISEHIRHLAIPASVGMFFSTMYNVTDTWFAGLVSTQAQAALTLSFPVFFLIISVGSGLQVGSTALIGGALGAKDRKQAAAYVVQAVSFGLVTSLFLTMIGLWSAPYLFRIMGAQGEYLDLCMQYMTPILWAAPAIIALNMLNATLQAVGDTRTFRNFIMLGAVLNCGLDPWFIFGGFGLPAMGFAGVARATVLIHCLGIFYLVYRVRRTGLLTTNRGRNLIPDPAAYAAIAMQGLPACINFMTIGLGVFVINSFVADFGQKAVAAYGIAMRVEQLALLPAMGLNVASLTITAQSFGAGNLPRIREAVRTCLKYGAFMMLPAAIPIIGMARPFMRFFSSDPGVIEAGVSYLHVDALVLFGYVVIFVNTSVLQGMKRPLFAIWLGLGRQLAAPVLLFWFCTKVLNLGLVSLWWSIFIMVWTSAGIAYWYAKQKIEREESAQIPKK